MPEAVASNSMPPTRIHLSGDVVFGMFDDTIHELEALTMMLEATLDNNAAFSDSISVGISSLFRRAVDDLQGIYKAALEVKRPTVADYLETHLMRIIAQVWSEQGLTTGDEIGDRREIRASAWQYAAQITEKLEDRHDLVEAGSFLPWAEMTIRKALAEDRRTQPQIMRDQLIVESVQAGHSISDIAIALGWSSETVEKAYARLAGKRVAGDGLPDNVRQKIERASDAA